MSAAVGFLLGFTSSLAADRFQEAVDGAHLDEFKVESRVPMAYAEAYDLAVLRALRQADTRAEDPDERDRIDDAISRVRDRDPTEAHLDTEEGEVRVLVSPTGLEEELVDDFLTDLATDECTASAYRNLVETTFPQTYRGALGEVFGREDEALAELVVETADTVDVIKETVDDLEPKLEDLIESLKHPSGIRDLLGIRHAEIEASEFFPHHLRPEYELIEEVLGYGEERDELVDWTLDSDAFSWTAVVGDGGVGKTRLGRWLIQEARDPESDVLPGMWDAGFLRNTRDESNLGEALAQRFDDWSPSRNILVVVDYARRNYDLLCNHVFPELCDLARNLDPDEGDPRIRLLLLDRLDEDVNALTKRVASNTDVTTGLAVRSWSDPIALDSDTSVTALGSRSSETRGWARRVLKATMEGLEREGLATAVPIPEFSEEEWRWIENTTGYRPLLLQLLAYQATREGSFDSLGEGGQEELLTSAVTRETRYLEKAIQDLTPGEIEADTAITNLVAEGVSYVTLRDGVPAQELREFLADRAERKGIGYENPRSLVGAVKRGRPVGRTDSRTTRVRPLEPDLVGSAFLVSTLGDVEDPDHVVRAALEATESDDILQRLDLAVRDLDGQTEIGGQSSLSVLSKETLEDLSDRIEFKSRARTYLGLGIQRALVDRARSRLDDPDEDPREARADLAVGLKSLGIRRTRLGMEVRARDATEEAVEIFEDLGSEFRKDLGDALNNLSTIYEDLGEAKEARDAAQRAVETFRELAEDNVGDYLYQIATSIDTLATTHKRLGNIDEALDASERATSIGKDLALRDPERYRDSYAGFLHNLGTARAANEDYEESLEALQESESMYVDAAQEHPNRFLPEVATARASIAAVRSEIGDYEGAVDAFEECIDVRERLAKHYPRVFNLSLATTYENLASLHMEEENTPEAIEALEHAIHILETQVEEDSFDSLESLAECCEVLSTIHAEEGHREAKQRVRKKEIRARESIVRHLSLMEENSPESHAPQLARALGALGATFQEVEAPEDAAEAFREGALALRPLVESENRDAADLARKLLEDYVQACEDADIPPEEELKDLLEGPVRKFSRPRLEDFRRKIEELKPKAREDPEEHAIPLANTYGGLGRRLRRQDSPEEAAEAFRDGALALQPLLHSGSQDAADLARRLLNDHVESCEKADIDPAESTLERLGDRIEELATPKADALREQIEELKPQARDAPEDHAMDLARTYGQLGADLLGDDSPEEAAEAFRKGAVTLEPLLRVGSEAAPDLARRLIMDHTAAARKADIPPAQDRLESVWKVAVDDVVGPSAEPLAP